MKSKIEPDVKGLPDRDGTPVLAGYWQEGDRETDTLVVWCGHCGKFHSHGRGGKIAGGGDGHRIAHCLAENSPYKKGGYYIREVAQFPERWRGIKGAGR